MIKDLQVTLYEIFGYLLPGGIVMGALAVAFCALYLPMGAVSFDLPTAEVWICVLALAYVSGHMGQAIANFIVKRWDWNEAKIVEQLPQEIRDTVKDKLKATLGDKATALGPRWVYELCDDAVIRSGKLGEREVYVYREGFYRGTCVGFALMTLALAVLAVRLMCESPHSFTIRSWTVTPAQLVFFMAVSALWSVLALRRYWRFMDYRVRHSVMGFLTLNADPPEKKKESTGG